MIKLAPKDLSAGMVTAAPVYSKTGQILYPAHTVITSQCISYLEFYGIKAVQIIPENEVTDSNIEDSSKKEEISYSQQVRRSREFHLFKVDYSQKRRLLKESFGNVIEKKEHLDFNALLNQVSSLYTNHLTSLSVFDMLHNMLEIDDTTYAHCINVAIISRMMGRWLHFSQEDLEILTLAGLLHDIGKCMIDPKILSKSTPLTPEELKKVKKHPSLGAKILDGYQLDGRIRSTALMHHERCNGSGYPSGLQGEAIAEFAKIIAIADVYDAMTSNRCYRKGICPFEVIATFERKGFEKYDSKYLLPFLTHIIETYMGNTVLLNDGTTGKIIYINNLHLSRPLIQSTKNEYLDLSKHPELYIQAIV